MIEVYNGFFVFLIVYLCYLCFIVLNKKKLKKYINKSKEANMLKLRFKLDYDKLNHKMVANSFGLANGFIIGLAYIVISLVKNIFLKLLLAFVVIVTLTLIIYMLLGKMFKRKEVK